MKPLILIRGVGLTLAITLSHTVAAAAASGGESTPLHLGAAASPSHAASSTGSSLVRTIVGLFVVIVVIYGISWILRLQKGGKNRASGDGLAAVASLPLGPGRSLALVRVGRELVLLGVAEHGVTAIRSYTEKEALAGGLDFDTDQGDGLDPVAPPVGRALAKVRQLTQRP
jgi:flagellar protein FliO/FliZ